MNEQNKNEQNETARTISSAAAARGGRVFTQLVFFYDEQSDQYVWCETKYRGRLIKHQVRNYCEDHDAGYQEFLRRKQSYLEKQGQFVLFEDLNDKVTFVSTLIPPRETAAAPVTTAVENSGDDEVLSAEFVC